MYKTTVSNIFCLLTSFLMMNNTVQAETDVPKLSTLTSASESTRTDRGRELCAHKRVQGSIRTEGYDWQGERTLAITPVCADKLTLFGVQEQQGRRRWDGTPTHNIGG